MKQLSVFLFLSLFAAISCGTKFLPTMERSELIEIIKLVADSRNETIYDRADSCNSADQVVDAFVHCATEIVGAYKGAKMYERKAQHPEYIGQVIDCMSERITTLNDEEIEQQKKYEVCMRKLREDIESGNNGN